MSSNQPPLQEWVPKRGERLRRKTHKNSKDGCPNCRALRIKCTEDLPSCMRCLARGYRCGYLDFEPEKLNHIRNKNELLKTQTPKVPRNKTQNKDRLKSSSAHEIVVNGLETTPCLPVPGGFSRPQGLILPIEVNKIRKNDHFFARTPVCQYSSFYQDSQMLRRPQISKPNVLQISPISPVGQIPQSSFGPCFGPIQGSSTFSHPYLGSYGLLSPPHIYQPPPTVIVPCYVPVLILPKSDGEDLSFNSSGNIVKNEF